MGGGTRIGSLEEDDNSPTSGVPLSILEGTDVVGSESITGSQEGFTNCILQTTYWVMEPIHVNRPLESSEESDTCLESHPSLSQESQPCLTARVRHSCYLVQLLQHEVWVDHWRNPTPISPLLLTNLQQAVTLAELRHLVSFLQIKESAKQSPSWPQ